MALKKDIPQMGMKHKKGAAALSPDFTEQILGFFLCVSPWVKRAGAMGFIRVDAGCPVVGQVG
jgi:hypothetical protein